MDSGGLYAPAAAEGTEELLTRLWRNISVEINSINESKENWKIQKIPLARVKKIMKAEEFVMQELERDRLRREELPEDDASKVKFMIASDAPLLLSRACEFLIRELTTRAWQHTERNRRRTLQRQDLHAAVGESEMFDFLIDIVPRVTGNTRPPEPSGFAASPTTPSQSTTAAAPEAPSLADTGLGPTGLAEDLVTLEGFQDSQPQTSFQQQQQQPNFSMPYQTPQRQQQHQSRESPQEEESGVHQFAVHATLEDEEEEEDDEEDEETGSFQASNNDEEGSSSWEPAPV